MSVTTIMFAEAADRRILTRTIGLLRRTHTGSFPSRYAFKLPARAAGDKHRIDTRPPCRNQAQETMLRKGTNSTMPI